MRSVILRIAFPFFVGLFVLVFPSFLFVFFLVFVFGNSSKQGVGFHATSGKCCTDFAHAKWYARSPTYPRSAGV
jgi:hypothetical protein